MRPLYAATDAAYAALAQERPVACAEGCAACCTAPVFATVAEGEHVAAAIERLPGPTRSAVLGRLASWRQAWRRVTGGASAAQVSADLRPYLAWSRQRLACPMLDPATHRCLVYADRPLTCRTHHACQPEPGAVSACGRCPVATPGDGCFGQREAAHGHPPAIQTMAPDFEPAQQRAYARTFGRPVVGLLPEVVHQTGRWAGITPKPLYRLAHARPG